MAQSSQDASEARNILSYKVTQKATSGDIWHGIRELGGDQLRFIFINMTTQPVYLITWTQKDNISAESITKEGTLDIWYQGTGVLTKYTVQGEFGALLRKIDEWARVLDWFEYETVGESKWRVIVNSLG